MDQDRQVQRGHLADVAVSSEPASPWRVFFAILCCAIAVLVAAAATVVGYYAFAGYGWTRVGALVAAGVSLLSLLLTPIAAISIGCVALGAAPLWLPASARFFARWHLIRHPQIAYSEPIEQVFYGPLPATAEHLDAATVGRRAHAAGVAPISLTGSGPGVTLSA